MVTAPGLCTSRPWRPRPTALTFGATTSNGFGSKKGWTRKKSERVCPLDIVFHECICAVPVQVVTVLIPHEAVEVPDQGPDAIITAPDVPTFILLTACSAMLWCCVLLPDGGCLLQVIRACLAVCGHRLACLQDFRQVDCL